VAEGVEWELRDLRQRAGLRMLLLERRLLDVAATRWLREDPFAVGRRAPRFQDVRRPLRQRDRAPGVFGFAVWDVDRTVLDVFPT
jgi:hypothetical protein